MPSQPEKIKLNKPLRDARLVGASYDVSVEQRFQARLRTSFERGRVEGEKALGVQLVQQRSDLLSLQSGVLDSLRQSVAQTTRECENALVELALEVAQKLVAGMPVSAEMVAAAVKEAIAQVQDTNDFVVLLNPADLELLKNVNSPTSLASVAGERMRFEASAEVTRGGCIVQTSIGTVDARRETKFEMLKKSILN
jgi:flagellar assembly protein FliH